MDIPLSELNPKSNPLTIIVVKGITDDPSTNKTTCSVLFIRSYAITELITNTFMEVSINVFVIKFDRRIHWTWNIYRCIIS